MPDHTRNPPNPIAWWRKLFHTRAGILGLTVITLITLTCFLSLPWTLATIPEPGYASLGNARPTSPRYDAANRAALRLPPSWAAADDNPALLAAARDAALRHEADHRGVTLQSLLDANTEPTPHAVAAHTPRYLLGTDHLGRSLLPRCLLGGALSLSIGIAAAIISVALGVLYGALSGFLGGRADALMMRAVDVLYGLPYVLLVVLLAVAVDATLDRLQTARVNALKAQSAAFIEQHLAQLPEPQRTNPDTRATIETLARQTLGSAERSVTQTHAVNLLTLLIAIGGVSWLTMARVIRGQVLSLKAQPFMEAARAAGIPVVRQFTHHLLPNLVGPIIVYATLTIPQAILQESFLSFLGIGVKPPLPSWGNLAADALGELNTAKSHWWLLLFPCLLLAVTLLALNYVGESLREAIDPRSHRNRADARGGNS